MAHLTLMCVFQRLPPAPASSGVRRAEGVHHGPVLLHDELRGLLHDVPPDQGAVCHQAVHHIQHVGGTSLPGRSD